MEGSAAGSTGEAGDEVLGTEAVVLEALINGWFSCWCSGSVTTEFELVASGTSSNSVIFARRRARNSGWFRD
jgi:hypothetical protein